MTIPGATNGTFGFWDPLQLPGHHLPVRTMLLCPCPDNNCNTRSNPQGRGSGCRVCVISTSEILGSCCTSAFYSLSAFIRPSPVSFAHPSHSPGFDQPPHVSNTITWAMQPGKHCRADFSWLPKLLRSNTGQPTEHTSLIKSPISPG